MVINEQKELEIYFLSKRLKMLSAHVTKFKKDHGAKITLAKTVYKIKALNNYLKRLERTKQRTQTSLSNK